MGGLAAAGPFESLQDLVKLHALDSRNVGFSGSTLAGLYIIY
jgi:hypothetical protein